MVTFSSSTHWSFSATITVIGKIHLYRLVFSTHGSQDAPRGSSFSGDTPNNNKVPLAAVSGFPVASVAEARCVRRLLLLLGNEVSEADGLISMALANTGSMTHANAEATASQIQGLNANWCRCMAKEELSKLSTSIESLKTMVEGTKIGMW